MTMLSMAVLYEQKNSKFAQIYAAGKASKKVNWEYYLEDSLDLTAKIPRIAAIIYRHKYHVTFTPPSLSTIGLNAALIIGYEYQNAPAIFAINKCSRRIRNSFASANQRIKSHYSSKEQKKLISPIIKSLSRTN